MNNALIFTLHGLRDGSEKCRYAQSPAEERYAISAEKFKTFTNALPGERVAKASDLTTDSNGLRYVITFDDGLLSDFEIALPILRQSDMKATFFITAKNIGKTGYLDGHQLREMADSGMEIGSHGLTHDYLVNMSKDRAKNQIAESKERLEQVIGSAIQSYAPVGGHYRSWMVEEVKKSGYKCFATMIPGLTRLEKGMQLVRRNHLQEHHTNRYIQQICRCDMQLLNKNRIKYYALYLPKVLLGLDKYDKIKSALFGH